MRALRFVARAGAAVACLGGGSSALASGGIPQTIDFYAMVLQALHIDHVWVPTVGGLFVLMLITVAGVRYRAAVSAGGDDVIPDGRFSLRYVVDTVLDMVLGITKDNAGHEWRRFFPFLAGLFIFILVCNLTGLVPGFHPATMSMDTNVAMGLIVFVVYNYAGLKEHGGGYVKHFLGPVWWIAPLFFVIELISHGSRPLSLGLRLMGNIFGDHTLLGVWDPLESTCRHASLSIL